MKVFEFTLPRHIGGSRHRGGCTILHLDLTATRGEEDHEEDTWGYAIDLH